MFEDSRINIFLAVCEECSFTKAAKRLGVSQPAVSQNIAEIEKGIGVRLFTRDRNSVALTEEGKRFKEFAEQIVYWYGAATDAFKETTVSRVVRGERNKKDLHIGISDDYRCFLVPQGSPEVDIDIESLDGGGMSVRVIQKKTEPEGSANVLF